MARPAVAATPNTNRALQCEPISRAPACFRKAVSAIRPKLPSPSPVLEACRRRGARPAQRHDRHETAMSATVSRRFSVPV
jgi:hypothetical protein